MVQVKVVSQQVNLLAQDTCYLRGSPGYFTGEPC